MHSPDATPLDTEPPTSSKTWIAMSRELQHAAWTVARATHCLYEWPQLQEDRPDTPTRTVL